MSVFDADGLVRLAARIEDHAGALRGRARAVDCAARQTRWHSPAATTWREQMTRLDRRIQHAAHNLERAAHELRLHADRVRTVQAAMGAALRLERVAVSEARHVIDGSVRTVEHAGGWVGDHL